MTDAAHRTTSRFPMARRQMVWLSAAAAMTLVGGALFLLQDDHRPGALMMAERAAAPASDISAIFDGPTELDAQRWQGIVIHHSGSTHGAAASIDLQYRQAGLHGLGYHFVLTNGHGGPDGAIHVGYRWDQQLAGAHVTGPESDFYNRNTIGICLVGDGERRTFTDAQLARLVQLVETLQERFDIPDRDVVLHRDVAATSSPGRLFPEAAFREQLAIR